MMLTSILEPYIGEKERENRGITSSTDLSENMENLLPELYMVTLPCHAYRSMHTPLSRAHIHAHSPDLCIYPHNCPAVSTAGTLTLATKERHS